MQGAGAAGVAFIGAEYLLPLVLLPARARPERGAAAGALALMLRPAGAQLPGIRTGARTQNVLSLAKIAMILGLGAGGRSCSGAPPRPPASRAPGRAASVGGLIAAAVAVLLHLRRLPEHHEPRRRRARRAPQPAARRLRRHGDRHRPLPAASTSPTSGRSASTASRHRRSSRPRWRAQRSGPSGEARGLARDLPVRGRLRERDDPPDAAQLLRDGRGRRACRAPSCASTRARRSRRPAWRSSRPRCCVPALLLGSFEKLLSYVMFTDALVAGGRGLERLRAAAARTGRTSRSCSGCRGLPVLPAIFMACLLAVCVHVLFTETRLAIAGVVVLLLGWPLFSLARSVTR